MCLICLILFQADKWEQVSPDGDAPTARWSHAAAFDPTNMRFWVFGGYDSPLLSVVDHAH